MDRADILLAIDAERERQRALFDTLDGSVPPTDFMWPSICAEQLGKALSVLQYIRQASTPDRSLLDAYEMELVKTAASAVQAIERFQEFRRRFEPPA